MNVARLFQSINLLIFSFTILVLCFSFLFNIPQSNFTEPVEDLSIYKNEPNGWHKFDLGAFSLSTPRDFRYRKISGIDSYVGVITNGKGSIHFDYGWYSNSFNSGRYLRSYDTINGVPSVIALDDEIIKGVYFANVRGDNHLSIFCGDFESEDALKVISSVKFPHRRGVTSVNLVFDEISSTITNGQKLFVGNCTVCHQLNKKVIGPPLAGVVSRTSKFWFENWVNNPEEFIESNHEAKQLFEEYLEIRHTKFNFSKQEIDNLIKYVENGF